jgi:hypothetical protein
MEKKRLGDFPKVIPTEEVTGKGIAVLAAFFAFYIVLYAISYPLGRLADNALLDVAFADFFSLCFLLLALVGLLLVAHYRRHFAPGGDILASLFLAALVWLAIQAQYWYNGWTTSIAYYDPTFHAVETFLISLGAICLLKAHPVLRFSLARERSRRRSPEPGAGRPAGHPLRDPQCAALHLRQRQKYRARGRPHRGNYGAEAGDHGRDGVPAAVHGTGDRCAFESAAP